MNIGYFPGQHIVKSGSCILSMNMIDPDRFFDINELLGTLNASRQEVRAACPLKYSSTRIRVAP